MASNESETLRTFYENYRHQSGREMAASDVLELMHALGFPYEDVEASCRRLAASRSIRLARAGFYHLTDEGIADAERQGMGEAFQA